MTEALRSIWIAARAAWPGVEVDEATFVSFVAERMTRETDETKLRWSDLYLACACAAGDEAALQAFERAFFSEIDVAFHRRGRANVPPIDEVRQLVRYRLFVAEPGRPSRIAAYAGRGDLRSWFRVAISRIVLNLSMRPGRDVATPDDLLGTLLGSTVTPEIEHARSAYHAEFRAAFDDAFAALDERERSLLRYAFIEDLGVEAIGALHGVHKTTAARWIVKAHSRLLEIVRDSLMKRLGIDEREYASILRAVRSGLELSLERYLAVDR